MSYILKRKIRKYRKKFVLPVLSSNGTMGGSTFAVDCSTHNASLYETFNAGSSGTKNVDTHPNAAPQWESFYSPVPLKVTKLRIGQIKDTTQAQYYYITAYKIQVSDDNQTWTDVYSGTGSKPATTLTANIADSGYHKYYRVYVTSAAYYSSYPRVFFYGIDFDAEAEDAVFYDDEVISYAAKRKERKYYKYVYENWTQPVLTTNGTMGGDKFAVSATQLNTSQVPYCAMDGKDSTQWYSKNTGYPIPYIFYSPQELDITKLEIRCWCDNGAFKSFEIQNSMDGNSWQTIWSGNSGLPLDNAIHTVTVDLSNIENRRGKYWKINFLTPVNSSSLVADMVDFFITATAKTGVVEVSPEEYTPVTEGFSESFSGISSDFPVVTQVGSSDLYKVYWEHLKGTSGTYTEPAYTSYIKKTEFDALTNERVLTQYNEDGSLFENPKPMYKVDKYLTVGSSYRIGSPDYFFEDVVKSYVIGRK